MDAVTWSQCTPAPGVGCREYYIALFSLFESMEASVNRTLRSGFDQLLFTLLVQCALENARLCLFRVNIIII